MQFLLKRDEEVVEFKHTSFPDAMNKLLNLNINSCLSVIICCLFFWSIKNYFPQGPSIFYIVFAEQDTYIYIIITFPFSSTLHLLYDLPYFFLLV
jgi:hypothetical protein